MAVTLTRSQVKVCLRALINSDRGIPSNTEIIWKFRSVDRPLPCNMVPVDIRSWLCRPVHIPLDEAETEHLLICLNASLEAEAIDIVDQIQNV